MFFAPLFSAFAPPLLSPSQDPLFSRVSFISVKVFRSGSLKLIWNICSVFALINCTTHRLRSDVTTDHDIKSRRSVLSSRTISYVQNRGGAFCQTGLCLQVYYRHLVHLFYRLGSSEVAISLVRRINCRPALLSSLHWSLSDFRISMIKKVTLFHCPFENSVTQR